MTRQRTRNTACRINLIPSVKYCRQLSCFEFLKLETHRCRLSPTLPPFAPLLLQQSEKRQTVPSSFFESQQRKFSILESRRIFLDLFKNRIIKNRIIIRWIYFLLNKFSIRSPSFLFFFSFRSFKWLR